MMTISILGDSLLAAAGTLIIGAAAGITGGLAQAFVAKDPADATKPLKSVVIGVVAALGTLWASTPDTAIPLIGQSLLAGYFGRAVLAVLQTRVTAALESARKERAIAIARDAITLAERERYALLPGAAEAAPNSVQPDVAALRARLADIEHI